MLGYGFDLLSVLRGCMKSIACLRKGCGPGRSPHCRDRLLVDLVSEPGPQRGRGLGGIGRLWPVHGRCPRCGAGLGPLAVLRVYSSNGGFSPVGSNAPLLTKVKGLLVRK